MPYDEEEEESLSEMLTIGFQGQLEFSCHNQPMQVTTSDPFHFELKCFLCNHVIHGEFMAQPRDLDLEEET